MKFGVIGYKKPVRPNGKKWANLGDPIQSYALLKLYEEMGIDKDDIIMVNRHNTKNYDGEYVLLPFNCYNSIFSSDNTFPISPRIVPVFISFHCATKSISNDMINQLRTYQPIGCRDEETMKILRSHGILAYLSGCLTATLPKRVTEPKKQKIFFVDCPKSLEKFVPEEIKKYREFATHLPNIERTSDEKYLTDEEIDNYNNTAISLLKRYEKEATLVVTSRLHAASPCMAMGIPVILVRENFDTRYSWIDKFLPLYTPDKFSEINWYPEAIKYEKEKKQLKEMFIHRIKKSYDENSIIYNCSSMYEDRDKFNYNINLINAINELPFSTKNIKYAIWGLHDESINFYEVICSSFKNWHHSAFIDQSREGSFAGKKILRSADIDKLDKNIIYFVIPEAAHEFAAKYLDERKLNYVLLYEKTKFIVKINREIEEYYN